MAIIGKNVVMGFGDVGISSQIKGTAFDPTAKIKFYQLDSPHYDPAPENQDKSVIPVILIADLSTLEMLHKMTGQLLNDIYDRQLAQLDRKKQRIVYKPKKRDIIVTS